MQPRLAKSADLRETSAAPEPLEVAAQDGRRHTTPSRTQQPSGYEESACKPDPSSLAGDGRWGRLVAVGDAVRVGRLRLCAARSISARPRRVACIPNACDRDPALVLLGADFRDDTRACTRRGGAAGGGCRLASVWRWRRTATYAEPPAKPRIGIQTTRIDSVDRVVVRVDVEVESPVHPDRVFLCPEKRSRHEFVVRGGLFPNVVRRLRDVDPRRERAREVGSP